VGIQLPNKGVMHGLWGTMCIMTSLLLPAKFYFELKEWKIFLGLYKFIIFNTGKE